MTYGRRRSHSFDFQGSVPAAIFINQNTSLLHHLPLSCPSLLTGGSYLVTQGCRVSFTMFNIQGRAIQNDPERINAEQRILLSIFLVNSFCFQLSVLTNNVQIKKINNFFIDTYFWWEYYSLLYYIERNYYHNIATLYFLIFFIL